MTNQQIILKTQSYLQERFKSEFSGHDYWHLYRVWQLAKHIAKQEVEADAFVVELAALLHDIADWKFHNGDEEAGPKAAREWLESLDVDDHVIVHIEDVIRNISFKGAGTKPTMTTIEGRIVYDADKLDAMGAIGIARNFAYGGGHGWIIHDPELKPVDHKDFASWKQAGGSAINMFYEKFFLLKDRMFTKTGKAMAEHRHTVMEDYLKEFLIEWDGKR